jgi:hypothetical protein
MSYLRGRSRLALLDQFLHTRIILDMQQPGWAKVLLPNDPPTHSFTSDDFLSTHILIPTVPQLPKDTSPTYFHLKCAPILTYICPEQKRQTRGLVLFASK